MEQSEPTGTIYNIYPHCGLEGRRVRFSLHAPVFSDDGGTIAEVAGSWCSQSQRCASMQRRCVHACDHEDAQDPLLPAARFPVEVSHLGPGEMVAQDPGL